MKLVGILEDERSLTLLTTSETPLLFEEVGWFRLPRNPHRFERDRVRIGVKPAVGFRKSLCSSLILFSADNGLETALGLRDPNRPNVGSSVEAEPWG